MRESVYVCASVCVCVCVCVCVSVRVFVLFRHGQRFVPFRLVQKSPESSISVYALKHKSRIRIRDAASTAFVSAQTSRCHCPRRLLAITTPPE